MYREVLHPDYELLKVKMALPRLKIFLLAFASACHSCVWMDAKQDVFSTFLFSKEDEAEDAIWLIL